jgi:hypothetical protein
VNFNDPGWRHMQEVGATAKGCTGQKNRQHKEGIGRRSRSSRFVMV